MTHIWVLASGFFFANLMCLIAIWNNYSFNALDPKYVGSSYDPNRKEELDSMLLKSVEKYIKKYFNIKTSLEESVKKDISNNSSFFLGESISENNTEIINFKDKLKNYQTIKNSESSKFSMFLDKEKENIIILKISNEENKINKYDSKTGEVILYSIPVENFISNNNNFYNNFNSYNNKNFNKANGKSKETFNFSNFSNFAQKKIFLEKSLIKECWRSRFFGRIIGAVASSDKKKLSVFYSVVKGHTVTYRIRYFHDISCGNKSIKNSDAKMIENFNAYMDSSLDSKNKKRKANFIENYFEISDEIDNKRFNDVLRLRDDKNNLNVNNSDENKNEENIRSYKDKVFKNFFDDNSYDDFLLKGNTPITAMAIRDDVIAYARDLDYRQYYILKREKKTVGTKLENDKINHCKQFVNFNNSEKEINKNFNNNTIKYKSNNSYLDSINEDNYNLFDLNKTNYFNLSNLNNSNNDFNNNTITSTVWKVSSLGPKIDRKSQPFFHTNSLKFMEDPVNDYRLIQIFVSLNSTDISCYGYFRISNHTDFNENFTELTFTSIPFFKVFFINEILDGNEEFNLEKSVKKLKKYLQPTLFSNNFNSQDMIFEFTKSYLLLMHSNVTTGNVHFIRMRPDAKEKIAKIHSDMENENIVIKYEGKKDMVYLLKEKITLSENIEEANSFTEYSKSISLKNLPKDYRNKQPLTYLIEKIKDK